MYFISSSCRTWRQKGEGIRDNCDFSRQASDQFAISLDIDLRSRLCAVRTRIRVVTRCLGAIREFNSRNRPRLPQPAASQVSQIREPIACLAKNEPNVVSIQRRTRRQPANDTPKILNAHRKKFGDL